MYDLIIKKGTVIDGTGDSMFRADIAVRDDRIVAIGEVIGAAERVIDATGCYVTPGFIDVNNHSDVYWQLLSHPELESMVRQGVTTIIGGNSGSSLAPLLRPESIRSIQKWTDVGKINFNWLSMKEFLGEIERRKPAVNFATLVGHGTLRRGVMRDETRPIRPEEIRTMEKMLEQSFREGAIGFSTGLRYTHAKGASAREITELVKMVSRYGGIYATYLRDEGPNLVRAVEEAITVARDAGAHLHISHLKAVGPENWPLFDEVLNLISAADSSGKAVSFDVYPYTSTGSVLYTFLPDWITEHGRKLMLERLKDAETRRVVMDEMRASKTDFRQMTVLSSSFDSMLHRERIGDMANGSGKSPEEVVIDILLGSNGRAIVSFEALSPHNILKALQHPFSIVSSNGTGYPLSHKTSGERVHPRNFGTFPKVFAEYVRGQKALSWEEAVYKMTGKPAERFNVADRGQLREGAFADIVVFRPDEIRDKSTFDDPYQFPEGIRWVFVNGRPAVEEGRTTRERSGYMLSRKSHFLFW